MAREGEGMVQTDHDIIAKIAEAFYLFRKRNDIPGSAESDWCWAERAFKFFEERVPQNEWFERHIDEYGWCYPLYCQMRGI